MALHDAGVKHTSDKARERARINKVKWWRLLQIALVVVVVVVPV